ncbi:putative Ubiquitin-like domain superfamily, UBL3-like, ubiquitin domain-containing protein [Helianthus annuus]|nr:putative Ubiquitin-like domain superfamily, UBL3-like, ubiquitin domain-containing protein [Helianthus annuus]
MAEGNEYVELKFRIYDGTDISHSSYASSTTITALKQKLVSEWPQGLKKIFLFIHSLILFLYPSKVHGWSELFTKILDLVPSFPKVHEWSLWSADFVTHLVPNQQI